MSTTVKAAKKAAIKFKLSDFIAAEMAEARKTIADGEGIGSNVWLIGKGKMLLYAPVLFKDSAEKYFVYKQVSQMAAQFKAESLFMLNDTWLAPLPKGGEKFIRPSLNPNRTEAIFGSLILPDGSVAYTETIPYTRSGKRIVFGKARHDNPKELTSKQSLVPRWDGRADRKMESAVA